MIEELFTKEQHIENLKIASGVLLFVIFLFILGLIIVTNNITSENSDKIIGVRNNLILLLFIILLIFIFYVVIKHFEKTCPEKICQTCPSEKTCQTCPPEKTCECPPNNTCTQECCDNLVPAPINDSQEGTQTPSNQFQLSNKKQQQKQKKKVSIKKFSNINYEIIDNYVSVYSLWTESDNIDDIVFPEFNDKPIGFITEDMLELIRISSKEKNKLWDKQIVLDLKTDYSVLKSLFKMIDENYNDDVNKNVLIVTMDIVSKTVPKKVIMIYDEKSFVGFNKLSLKEFNSLEKSIYNMNYQLWVPYDRRFKFKL